MAMVRKKVKIGFVLLLALIIGVVIGCSVSLSNKPNIELINDREYFPVVYQEIKQADSSVHIVMFSLTYYRDYPQSNVNKLLEELVYAKSRGVDVKVVIDEYPEAHEEGVKFLKKFKVPVRYDGPEQTTHAKLVIIDGEEVIVGSTNWRYYSLEKNREANVLIRSVKVAQEFEEYFEGLWENSSPA